MARKCTVCLMPAVQCRTSTAHHFINLYIPHGLWGMYDDIPSWESQFRDQLFRGPEWARLQAEKESAVRDFSAAVNNARRLLADKYNDEVRDKLNKEIAYPARKRQHDWLAVQMLIFLGHVGRRLQENNVSHYQEQQQQEGSNG